MNQRSTVQNSKEWRMWHCVNYLIGGITFFLGSIIQFPIFTMYLDVASISAWLYTIGSFTFLLADLTEWLHYARYYLCCSEQTINFLVSVLGSTLYLVGSASYIPQLDSAALGANLFIIGSAVIVISQSWKVFRLFNQPQKTYKQCIKEDESGFYVDLFAGLGGLMYLIGTIVFLLPQSLNPNIYIYQITGVTIYSLGGTFFFESGLYMAKRYFYEAHIKRSVFTANGLQMTQQSKRDF